ncbi:putative secondary metabolism biosynthetic enzyme [Elasticomyces elasticus]|nr:putative secondary metabolism biosynthetic enzyme [Elasticomyces elasticus]
MNTEVGNPKATCPDPELRSPYRSSTSALQTKVHQIDKASGNYFHLSNGSTIFDAVGGAAVTNLGHGDKRIQDAICEQIATVDYCRSTLFTSKASNDLSRLLVGTTSGAMKRAMILSSGTEANDAMMKLCILYYRSINQPQRVRFIAREGSYHGSSVSTLTLGHHKRRRIMYQGILALEGPNISHVSRAHAFRDLQPGESEQQYVARLAEELENEFMRVGPETVCAFVAEPIVGSGLGGAVAPNGYFKAVKQVCQKYGALLVMDEVMCGLGRSGTYHAWQHPDIDVSPDLQTVGKTLGGGYIPVAALLIGQQVAQAMEDRQELFVHGATYEDHPVASAAALKVQQIVADEKLVDNVRCQGAGLLNLLQKRMGSHPCVGNIRGRGLFWGIEITRPSTHEPYPSGMSIAYRIRDAGLDLPQGVGAALGFDGISLFPMQGCFDGLSGDVIMLMPAFNITTSDVAAIVEAFAVACEEVLGMAGDKVAGELSASLRTRVRL